MSMNAVTEYIRFKMIHLTVLMSIYLLCFLDIKKTRRIHRCKRLVVFDYVLIVETPGAFLP